MHTATAALCTMKRARPALTRARTAMVERPAATAKLTPAAKTLAAKPALTPAAKPTLSKAAALGLCILDLGNDLVAATVVGRPSARNRSPYVGDVRLECGRVAIAHMPSMDMGGKCVAGARVLMRPATDKAGRPVGADATGKFGTPKCEFITQLLRVEEPENAGSGGVWIGAHPRLGEQIADALISGGHVPELRAATVRREVSGVAGTDMRCDFLLTRAEPGAEPGTSAAGPARTVVEVKTVVDTDYDPATAPHRTPALTGRPSAPMFLGRTTPYVRSAIFPWGGGKQLGPDGEKVVSARAIKHVRELAMLARGERTEAGGERLGAAVLFVVVRSDAARFRANAEACPSFARHLRAAHDAGVAVLAHRVRWGEGEQLGKAFVDGALPVDFD